MISISLHWSYLQHHQTPVCWLSTRLLERCLPKTSAKTWKMHLRATARPNYRMFLCMCALKQRTGCSYQVFFPPIRRLNLQKLRTSEKEKHRIYSSCPLIQKATGLLERPPNGVQLHRWTECSTCGTCRSSKFIIVDHACCGSILGACLSFCLHPAPGSTPDILGSANEGVKDKKYRAKMCQATHEGIVLLWQNVLSNDGHATLLQTESVADN